MIKIILILTSILFIGCIFDSEPEPEWINCEWIYCTSGSNWAAWTEEKGLDLNIPNIGIREGRWAYELKIQILEDKPLQIQWKNPYNSYLLVTEEIRDGFTYVYRGK